MERILHLSSMINIIEKVKGIVSCVGLILANNRAPTEMEPSSNVVGLSSSEVEIYGPLVKASSSCTTVPERRGFVCLTLGTSSARPPLD